MLWSFTMEYLEITPIHAHNKCSFFIWMPFIVSILWNRSPSPLTPQPNPGPWVNSQMQWLRGALLVYHPVCLGKCVYLRMSPGWNTDFQEDGIQAGSSTANSMTSFLWQSLWTPYSMLFQACGSWVGYWTLILGVESPMRSCETVLKPQGLEAADQGKLLNQVAPSEPWWGFAESLKT